MKIYIDTHTHSVASGQAYSTVDELAHGAHKRGLAGFVLTDHGPALPGGGSIRTILGISGFYPQKSTGSIFIPAWKRISFRWKGI